MRLFADENIAAQIVLQLRDLGHDVLYPPESTLTGDDETWLELARDERRTLITDDKDFGELVFRKKLATGGIILLRLHRFPLSSRLNWLKNRWPKILSHPEGSFVVVNERSIRVRPRSGST